TLDKLAALMGPAKTLAGRTANTVAPQNATAWADFTLLRLVRISTSLAGPTFVKTCQVSFRGKRDSSRGRAICRGFDDRPLPPVCGCKNKTSREAASKSSKNSMNSRMSDVDTLPAHGPAQSRYYW